MRSREERKLQLEKELASIKEEEIKEANDKWAERQRLLCEAAPYLLPLVPHSSTYTKTSGYCTHEYEGCVRCMLLNSIQMGYWYHEDRDIRIESFLLPEIK